ncbi:MAG: O-antigen ligase family protein [Thermoleophilia bacterium]
MTTEVLQPGRPSRRLIMLAGALGLLAVLIAYGMMSVAAGKATPVSALAVIVAPAFLVVALARPEVAGLAIPGLVFSNAGLVLNESHGIPNVTRFTMLLTLVLFLVATKWRSRVLVVTPVLWAGFVFVAIRVISAAQAPGATPNTVATNYAYGLGIVVVVTAVCSVPLFFRTAGLVVVASAALVSVGTVARRNGVGGTWGGFAGDTPVTSEIAMIENRGGVTIDLASRVAGPVADPNFWAQALVFAFPVSLWALRHRSGWASRALAVASVVAIVTSLMYTQSRGGAIAATIGLCVWMWFEGGRLRKAVWLVPIAAVVALASSSSASRFTDLQGLFNPKTAADGSITGRLSENLAALQMWQDRPVLGVGADQYPINYSRYAQKIGLDSRVGRFAHNSYLQMAAESGTLGLGAFLGMLITGFVTARRARARLLYAGLHREAGLVTAVMAGGIGFAVAAVFLHQAWPDYLWLILAMIGGAWLMGRRGVDSLDERMA